MCCVLGWQNSSSPEYQWSANMCVMLASVLAVLAYYNLELRELQSRHPVHCKGSHSIRTMIFCTLYNYAYMEAISSGIYAYIEVISFGIVAHDHLPSSLLSCQCCKVLSCSIHAETLANPSVSPPIRTGREIHRHNSRWLSFVCVARILTSRVESCCSKFAADPTHLPKSADSSCMQHIVAFQSD